MGVLDAALSAPLASTLPLSPEKMPTVGLYEPQPCRRPPSSVKRVCECDSQACCIFGAGVGFSLGLCFEGVRYLVMLQFETV